MIICSVPTAGHGGVCGRAQSGVHLCGGGLQSGARVHRRLHFPVHARQGPERVSRRGDVLQADQRLGLSAARRVAPLYSFTFTLLLSPLTTPSWPHHNSLKTETCLFFNSVYAHERVHNTSRSAERGRSETVQRFTASLQK